MFESKDCIFLQQLGLINLKQIFTEAWKNILKQMVTLLEYTFLGNKVHGRLFHGFNAATPFFC